MPDLPFHPASQRRVYPWTLTQLRMPHAAPEPTPEFTVSATGPTPRAARAVELFQEAGESELQWKMSAYVILELVRDALSVLDLGPYNTELAALDANLPVLLEIVHGQPAPDEVQDLIDRMWQIPYEIGDPSNELWPVGALLFAAFYASMVIASDRIERAEALQALGEPYSYEETTNSQFTTNSLFWLLVGLRRSLGNAAANEIIPLWWNRTFARLAFVQPEEPDASTTAGPRTIGISMPKKTLKEWKSILSKPEAIEEIGDYQFKVNSWGSVQYAGALAFYKVYFLVRQDLDMEDTLKAFGISAKWKDIRSVEEAQELYLADIEKELEEAKSEKDEYGIKYAEKDRHCAIRITTGDDFFLCFRMSASDLWTAAPQIAEYFLEDLKIKGVKKAPGVGPVGNQLVQSKNYMTGLNCALLKDLGIVHSSEAFGDFDT